MRELEAREAIRELITRYCWAIDVRDREAFLDVFTPDVAYVRRSDGSWAHGREALWEQVQARVGPMGPTLHYATAAMDIRVDGQTASSVHLGLAEHAVADRLVLGAFTYEHEYRIDGDSWRISRRRLIPWYFCHADDLVAHYGSRTRHWFDGTTPREPYPQRAESWQSYHAGALDRSARSARSEHE